jgi:hypothetical protein
VEQAGTSDRDCRFVKILQHLKKEEKGDLGKPSISLRKAALFWRLVLRSPLPTKMRDRISEVEHSVLYGANSVSYRSARGFRRASLSLRA